MLPFGSHNMSNVWVTFLMEDHSFNVGNFVVYDFISENINALFCNILMVETSGPQFINPVVICPHSNLSK